MENNKLNRSQVEGRKIDTFSSPCSFLNPTSDPNPVSVPTPNPVGTGTGVRLRTGRITEVEEREKLKTDVQWSSDIYAYNKNNVKLLPIADVEANNTINSYINLRNLEGNKRRNKKTISKRLHPNKMFSSKPYVAHTNHEGTITIFVYNKKQKHLNSITKKLFNKKLKHTVNLNMSRKFSSLKQKINKSRDRYSKINKSLPSADFIRIAALQGKEVNNKLDRVFIHAPIPTGLPIPTWLSTPTPNPVGTGTGTETGLDTKLDKLTLESMGTLSVRQEKYIDNLNSNTLLTSTPTTIPSPTGLGQGNEKETKPTYYLSTIRDSKKTTNKELRQSRRLYKNNILLKTLLLKKNMNKNDILDMTKYVDDLPFNSPTFDPNTFTNSKPSSKSIVIGASTGVDTGIKLTMRPKGMLSTKVEDNMAKFGNEISGSIDQKREYLNEQLKLAYLHKLKTINMYAIRRLMNSFKDMYKDSELNIYEKKLAHDIIFRNLISKHLSTSVLSHTNFTQELTNEEQVSGITNEVNKNDLQILDVIQAHKGLLTMNLYQKKLMHLRSIQDIYYSTNMFSNWFMLGLKNLLSQLYNKTININIVNLKHIYLNADIFAELIASKLRNRMFSPSRVMKKALQMVKLNPKYVTFTDTISSISSDLDLDSTRSTYGNFKEKRNNKSNLENRPTLSNSLSFYPILDSLQYIKYKAINGVRIEASGRLSRRITASRSLHKIRHVGSIRDPESLDKRSSYTFSLGYRRSNVQYGFVAGKRVIGSYGLKVLVSSSNNKHNAEGTGLKTPLPNSNFAPNPNPVPTGLGVGTGTGVGTRKITGTRLKSKLGMYIFIGVILATNKAICITILNSLSWPLALFAITVITSMLSYIMKTLYDGNELNMRNIVKIFFISISLGSLFYMVNIIFPMYKYKMELLLPLLGLFPIISNFAFGSIPNPVPNPLGTGFGIGWNERGISKFVFSSFDIKRVWWENNLDSKPISLMEGSRGFPDKDGGSSEWAPSPIQLIEDSPSPWTSFPPSAPTPTSVSPSTPNPNPVPTPNPVGTGFGTGTGGSDRDVGKEPSVNIGEKNITITSLDGTTEPSAKAEGETSMPGVGADKTTGLVKCVGEDHTLLGTVGETSRLNKRAWKDFSSFQGTEETEQEQTSSKIRKITPSMCNPMGVFPKGDVLEGLNRYGQHPLWKGSTLPSTDMKKQSIPFPEIPGLSTRSEITRECFRLQEKAVYAKLVDDRLGGYLERLENMNMSNGEDAKKASEKIVASYSDLIQSVADFEKLRRGILNKHPDAKIGIAEPIHEVYDQYVSENLSKQD